MRRLKTAVVVGVAIATMAAVVGTLGPAGAQSGSSGKKTLYVIGGYETRGDSALGIPNFDDGAKLAVEELQKKGWTINYERIPTSGINAAAQEAVFLQTQQKNPDGWISLTSTGTFVPVGPKVAATDLPTFALSSPSEGVRTGPSGGDNIFILRPLNEATYASVLEFVCTDLAKQLKLKDVKIALNLVTTGFGPTVQSTVNREIPKYKNCEVVNTTTNGPTATDLTQQALSIKDSGANVIISANFPAPSGVLVNQLRQNGVTIPFVGGASLNLAVDAGSITNLSNLWASDDCVPELEKNKVAKKFVKAYNEKYGYAPNYASAQVYSAVNILANAVDEVGHDAAKINKKLAATDYAGVCHFINDKNNVLGQNVTVYHYKSPTDKTKVLDQHFALDFVPSDELGAVTTAPAAAPTTTVAR